MAQSTKVLSFVLAVSSSALAQVDRHVPSTAYPNFQAAINASSHGDRIVLANGYVETGSAVVNKAVTIEAPAGGHATFSYHNQSSWGGVQPLRFQVPASSFPLVLRRINLSLYEMGGSVSGIQGSVDGEVRLEDVSISYWGGYHGCWGPLLSLHASSVWMKRVQAFGSDRFSDMACWDTDRTSGISCVAVQANSLIAEDCSFYAGSAPWFTSHGTGCWGCQFGPYNHPGLPGGTALHATTQLTVLTRCSFVDGNGSSIAVPDPTAPCPTTATPGSAGASQFTGPQGTLIACGSNVVSGVPGGADGPRGPSVPLGAPLAPLTTGGPASPGSHLSIQVQPVPNNLALVILTLGWDQVPTPLGTLPLALASTLWSTAVTTPWSTQFAVPNTTSLRFLPLASQVFWFDPDIRVGNASGTWIDVR